MQVSTPLTACVLLIRRAGFESLGAHVGALLRALAWRRQICIPGKLHAIEWLFPGRQAGRHQHPDYLRVRLGSLGIDCGVQRLATLFQLASEVPASVLADMLHLSPSTAAKWVGWAGGNWTNYVADRMSVAMVGEP